jgi:hypothetical protein
MQIYSTPQDGKTSLGKLTHKSTTWSNLWATDSCRTTLNCTTHWQMLMADEHFLYLITEWLSHLPVSPHPTPSDHDSSYHIVFMVFTYCSRMPWEAGAAHSVTHIPVTEPLQLPSPVVEQQIPVVLLFGQGVEAVTHYDTAVMLSLWLWGPRAPTLPDVGIATEPVVWFREFVLDTAAIPGTVPEIHHHTLSISHYVHNKTYSQNSNF